MCSSDLASAYFAVGEYDLSLDDYQQYVEQKPAPLTYAIDFSLAFAKELPRGIKESGSQLSSFAYDIITHPIDTATEVGKAFAFLSSLVYSSEWEVIGQVLTPEIFELVTKWDTLSPEEQGSLSGYAFGKYGSDIFIPGAAVKLASKGAKSLTAACKSFKNAEQVLVLEGLAQSSGKSFINEQTISHSIVKHKRAQEFLKPYSKGYLTEHQARQLIHQAGLETFPRPKGIPENYRVKITDKSGGMKYVHPEIEQTFIRVMPGKPHSPFLHQQKPYVVQMKNGKTLDKFGKEVPASSPEAHIPMDEFIFIQDYP